MAGCVPGVRFFFGIARLRCIRPGGGGGCSVRLSPSLCAAGARTARLALSLIWQIRVAAETLADVRATLNPGHLSIVTLFRRVTGEI